MHDPDGMPTGKPLKRFAIVIGAAALGAAVIAVGASADFRSVGDPRGDYTRCHHGTGSGSGPTRPCSDSTKRDADIVRATAGHEGTRLRHTIRVVGKSKGAHLEISTDLDPGCEWEVSYINRGRGRPGVLRPCLGNGGAPTSRARYDFHHHSVEIFFRRGAIGNPRSYGWRASTFVGPWEGHVHDYVPNGGHYIRHRA
jgi:hypothetical protein